MECQSTCFKDYLVRCVDQINVYAQLTPLTAHIWVITDKFGNQNQGNFTTNQDGFWLIDVADLPPGMLTEFSGEFKLQVYGDECKPVKFKVAQEYDCITFRIHGGNRIKDSLGCAFTCLGDGGDQAALFPFDGEEQYVIAWTPFMASRYGQDPVVQVYEEVGLDTGIYELAIVNITTEGGVYGLTGILIEMGGVHSGYIVVS